MIRTHTRRLAAWIATAALAVTGASALSTPAFAGDAAATETVLTATPNEDQAGVVDLSALVTNTEEPEAVPAGSVQFYLGTDADSVETVVGEPQDLDGTGAASVSTEALTAGEYFFVAVFTAAEEAPFAPSTSEVQPLTVPEPPVVADETATVLTADLNEDGTADLSVVVSDVTVPETVLVGSVQFYEGADVESLDAPVGEPQDLVDGAAAVTTDVLDLGEHSFFAVFTSDDEATVASSVSAVEVVTVTEPEPPAITFNDVTSDNQFAPNIAWLVEQGITNGYADGGFHPTAPVSRQAMAAFLHRYSNVSAAQLLGAQAPATFNDVTSDNEFAADIAWLSDQHVTEGYTDGGFHPTAPVSRQAMAAFLYRFAGEPDYTAPTTSPFADVSTDDPFYAAIAWLNETDVATGYDDGGFHPTAPVSRQAMAAFLERFNNLAS